MGEKYLPVNACSWEASADAARSESVLFKVLDVPRIDTGGAEQDTTTLFKCVVEAASLGSGSIFSWIEPIH